MLKTMFPSLALPIGVASVETEAIAACHFPFDSKTLYQAVVDAYIAGSLRGGGS